MGYDLSGVGKVELDPEFLKRLQLDGVMPGSDTAEPGIGSGKPTDDLGYRLTGATVEERAGEAAGRFNAENYYGPTKQIGADSQGYTSMLKGKLGEKSADAEKYRFSQGRKNSLADARAQFSGVNTMAASQQNDRNTMFQADLQDRNYQNEQLAKYGKDIGRRVSGMETMANVGAGKAVAGQKVAQAAQDSGSLGCTILLGMGLMSRETYASEAAYINKDSLEYIGYAILLAPIVPLMYRSKLVANISSFFAHRYIWQVTGKKKSIVGKLWISFWMPICKMVGWING